MDRKTYERNTEKQLIGRKVMLLKEMRNGYAILPSGTIATITRKYSGFSLITDQCEHCGIKVPITRVPPEDVTFSEKLPDSKALPVPKDESGCVKEVND